MENKTNIMENENQQPRKQFAEAEMEVVQFEEQDVITASCLAAGTKITLANGTYRLIEDLREGDCILTFDHETGSYVEKPIMYLYHSEKPGFAFTLHFANGTSLSIVGEHDLFMQESKRYETIRRENANDRIGKHFYSAAEAAYTELLCVTFETKACEYYEVYTTGSLNMIANGMLNVADDVDFLLNIYTFDAALHIDKKALDGDIQTYGLYPCPETSVITEQAYNNWNMRYLNVALGKGLVTFDTLLQQFNENRKHHADLQNRLSA